MSDNKTKPTAISVEDFLQTLGQNRRSEAEILIAMMQQVSGKTPVMWGPSIIGFGTQHYKYDSGREGDMPHLAFSPRKAAITIYFSEGFDRYSTHLQKLGKYKASVSCLYINKLEDVDKTVLQEMIEESFRITDSLARKPSTVEEYVASVPAAARPQFDELRSMAKILLPSANEVLSYGIIGYKVDDKRARVYISGWKDHTSIYPVPGDPTLQDELAPYIKGKGTLSFPLNEPLPGALIKKTILSLVTV